MQQTWSLKIISTGCRSLTRLITGTDKLNYMKKNIFYIPLLFLLCCKSKEVQTDEEKTDVQTPVTVATVSHEPMEDYVELNATSIFLQKWDVKANITGYLQTANVQLNQPVTKGEILYTVKTKEAESIGNTIS